MNLPNPNYRLPIPLEALSLKMVNGFSPLLVVVGDETGIGKSRIALRIAELVYWRTYGLKWKPKNNVFFSMKEFKEELFNANGRILIIEEAEIELGSDDWQSISNRWFSRIKDTQRIKGNLYIIVLPMLMALAKKHRRRLNYIHDVKERGFANCYKIKKRSAQLLGDELSRCFIGSIILGLPDCDKQFDIMDRENKKRIEIEQGDLFDKEIRYRELMQENKLKKLEETVNGKKTYNKEYEYFYKCHACNKPFPSNKKINKVITCGNCHKRVFINEQNLVSKENVKLINNDYILLTNNLNDYEDEDSD